MHGLGTEDNPLFPGMHEASAMVTGATLAAARAVWTSTAQHGASIAGGLHHAMAGNASGFCVYNDCVTGRTAPERMTEGAFGVFPSFEGGYDPADAVDQAIMAARKAVFPLHGLMP